MIRNMLTLKAQMAFAMLSARPVAAEESAPPPPPRDRYDMTVFVDQGEGRYSVKTIRGPRVGRKPTKSMKKAAKKASRLERLEGQSEQPSLEQLAELQELLTQTCAASGKALRLSPGTQAWTNGKAP